MTAKNIQSIQIQGRLSSFIDFAHAAFADLLQDFIGSDLPSRDDVKVSSPVRRGRLEKEPQGHLARRLPNPIAVRRLNPVGAGQVRQVDQPLRLAPK